jgi:hypothetical protein
MSKNTDLAKFLLQLEELQAQVSQQQQRLHKFLPGKAKQKDEEKNHRSGSSVSIYVEKTVTVTSSPTGSSEMSPAHKKQRLTGPAFDKKWHHTIKSLMETEKWTYFDKKISNFMKTWTQDNIIQFFEKPFKHEEKFAVQPIEEQLKHIRTFCEENSIPSISEEDDEEDDEEEQEKEDHEKDNEEKAETKEDKAETDEAKTESDEAKTESDEAKTESDEEETEKDEGSLSEEY